MVKLRRMRWAGHVERTRMTKNLYGILAENMKGEEYLRYVLVDGGIILKWLKFWLKCMK
jgi:hypothetical protein